MATPIPENAAEMTSAELVAATAGTLVGAARNIRGVVTDSRAVGEGTLFVALRGERFDGHRFLESAVEAGAAALLVARDANLDALDESGPAAVIVGDTTQALGDVAAFHRKRWGRPVVAITGSAGKTSTKELIAAALSAGGTRVARTRGNLNNLVGVPMTLLCLDDEADLAVVEMGTSAHGEIARLAAIGQPDIGVITLVSAAHTEGLGTVDDVGREKRSLLGALGPAGIAVLSADDPQLKDAAHDGAKTILFGEAENADVRLLSYRVDAELVTIAHYAIEGQGELEVRLRLLGRAAAMNAAAALAVCLARGVDLRAAAEKIAEVEPTPGRFSPSPGGAYCVIDDSYNAHPRSTMQALDTAASLAAARGVGFVAVLADMLELGELSESAHRELGEKAAELGPRGLVFVGAEMRHAAAAAEALGANVTHVEDAADAIAPASAIGQSGDVVLVKGSRGMRTERVVAALTGEVAS